jgi:hypothetical protein
MFAESCRSGRRNELSAYNGTVAVAIVYAALKSMEENGQRIRIADLMQQVQSRIGARVEL